MQRLVKWGEGVDGGGERNRVGSVKKKTIFLKGSYRVHEFLVSASGEHSWECRIAHKLVHG